MIKAPVTYYPNEWAEVSAELCGKGMQWDCRITHIAILPGCPEFEIDIEQLQAQIVKYYTGRLEQDDLAAAKSLAELEMEVG